MSGCGNGNCSCGSNCGCGSSCNCSRGSGMYSDFGFSEKTTTETLILGVPSAKMHYEVSEVSFGAENGCKCGSNCTCDPCNCK